jgi:hypothetical protein
MASKLRPLGFADDRDRFRMKLQACRLRAAARKGSFAAAGWHCCKFR